MLPDEKLHILAASSLFSTLTGGELSAIAKVARSFEYDPQTPMLRDATVPTRLFIIAVGGVIAINRSGEVTKQLAAPLTLGATNILLNLQSCHRWRASAEGAQGLFIQRNHFLTVTHRCPHILRIFFAHARPERELQGAA